MYLTITSLTLISRVCLQVMGSEEVLGRMKSYQTTRKVSDWYSRLRIMHIQEMSRNQSAVYFSFNTRTYKIPRYARICFLKASEDGRNWKMEIISQLQPCICQALGILLPLTVQHNVEFFDTLLANGHFHPSLEELWCSNGVSICNYASYGMDEFVWCYKMCILWVLCLSGSRKV